MRSVLLNQDVKIIWEELRHGYSDYRDGKNKALNLIEDI